MELWRRVANLVQAERASALILHIYPVARDVSLAAGSDQSMGPEGVAKITQPLGDYFVPDAVDPFLPIQKDQSAHGRICSLL